MQSPFDGATPSLWAGEILQRRRLVCGSILALGLSGPLAAAEHRDQLERIRSARVLRVAVPQDFPPFGFPQGSELAGFDISIAKMLSMHLGVSPQMVPVPSGDRLAALLEDRVDIIISSLGKTPEREKSIDFSNVYAPTYLGVFSQQKLSRDELLKLPAPVVGAAENSLEESLVRAFLPTAKIQGFKGSAALLDAYAAGHFEFFAGGNVLVESIKDVGLRTRVHQVALLKESPCYIGLRQNEARLKDEINRFLASIRSSGALMVNAMKWFRQSFSADMFK